jgi:hypothetical protein
MSIIMRLRQARNPEQVAAEVSKAAARLETVVARLEQAYNRRKLRPGRRILFGFLGVLFFFSLTGNVFGQPIPMQDGTEESIADDGRCRSLESVDNQASQMTEAPNAMNEAKRSASLS